MGVKINGENWRKSLWWIRQKKESHGGDEAGSNPEQSHLENKGNKKKNSSGEEQTFKLKNGLDTIPHLPAPLKFSLEQKWGQLSHLVRLGARIELQNGRGLW